MKFSTFALFATSALGVAALNERDIPGTTITKDGTTLVNSGIHDETTAGSHQTRSYATTGSVTIVIGSSTYLEPGSNGGNTQSGGSSEATGAAASTAASTSPSHGGAAQITQAPLVAGGMAAIAYLVL